MADARPEVDAKALGKLLDKVLGGLAPEVVAYEPPPPATGGRQAGQATGTYTFAFAKYSATFTLKFSIEAMGDGTVLTDKMIVHQADGEADINITQKSYGRALTARVNAIQSDYAPDDSTEGKFVTVVMTSFTDAVKAFNVAHGIKRGAMGVAIVLPSPNEGKKGCNIL